MFLFKKIEIARATNYTNLLRTVGTFKGSVQFQYKSVSYLCGMNFYETSLQKSTQKKLTTNNKLKLRS